MIIVIIMIKIIIFYTDAQNITVRCGAYYHKDVH